MNYERTTLPNGLRLLTASMPSMRSASIAFFFKSGSRYEQIRVAGISHFKPLFSLDPDFLFLNAVLLLSLFHFFRIDVVKSWPVTTVCVD